jgi:hypothetical protein
MFSRLKRLLGREPALYQMDEDWVSMSMLVLLSEENSITRDRLANILRAKFGGVDFRPFPDVESFFAAIGPEYSDGFKALAVLAFVVLAATDFPYEQIRATLHDMFVFLEAEQLPEFVEARRRFDEIDACAGIPDPPSGSIAVAQ